MLIPAVASEWWTIASPPDLGPYDRDTVQPMDFSVWQAADGSWQLGACVRGTGCGGHGRLLYRWESGSLEAQDWAPRGILLESDEKSGETPGGLQAPFVLQDSDRYVMFYGDWVNICLAISTDGKSFDRRLDDRGHSAIFNEGRQANTRDPMSLKHEGRYYVYYTGVVDDCGAIYCRMSDDLRHWSDSRIVCSGGSGGSGPADAECVFVSYHEKYDQFCLLRWHSDGLTSVYWSDDPLDFGVDSDEKRIGELSVEVARVIHSGNQSYLSSLNEDYSGIRLAKMHWVEAVRQKR